MTSSNVTFHLRRVRVDCHRSTHLEETARAALAMVNEHLGERPVRAVIYTHSHTDHLGASAVS